MKKLITIEWNIKDTRQRNPSYRTGISKIQVKCKSYVDAMNYAIQFAENLPKWEFERNGINLEEYTNYPECRYYYETKLSRIINIENVK